MPPPSAGKREAYMISSITQYENSVKKNRMLSVMIKFDVFYGSWYTILDGKGEKN
jgi:hypothetical protein